MLKLKNKKALSQIITTVLLIVLALVIASLILVWAKGFIKESVLKFDEPIERSCSQVVLESSLVGNQLLIVNQGSVPVYKLALYISSGPDHDIISPEETNFLIGSSRAITLDLDESQTLEKLIPILRGKTKSGEIGEYKCPEINWVSVE